MRKNILTITIALMLIVFSLQPALLSAQVKQLWGMTYEGGHDGLGCIFKTDSVGNNETVQYDFLANGIGDSPLGSLMQASDGNLYGLTYEGGTHAWGVLFQYNPVDSFFTDAFDFDGTNGNSPTYNSLMQASDGNLYGMTFYGGAKGLGVLFQYNPATSVFTKKFDFDGSTKGAWPEGSLMQASDGNLYGMTAWGGAHDFGVLFQYNPVTSVFTKKFDFDSINGSAPYGNLVQVSDVSLYGMTDAGGTHNLGVLFQYNFSTSGYTKKIDFDSSNGGEPIGSLILASDGNLYGMTELGGANNVGVLFQYNPSTSVCTKKIDFDCSTNGCYSRGSLMQASDGNLYGMPFGGGANNDGVIFQYNPVTSVYTKKLDFAGQNGAYPNSLIEINVVANGIQNYSFGNFISLYPNPANSILTIHATSTQNEMVMISVFNVLGQTIQEEKIKLSNETNINIKTLSSGIYFLEIKSESASVVKEFVKE